MQTRWWVKALAAVGAIAIALAVGGAIAGLVVLRQGFSARPSPSGVERSVAMRLRSLAVPSRYRRMNNPVGIDDAMLARAMAHWADHCALCHANDGSGQSTIGRNLYPRAPDMRAPRTQELTDGELYYVINQGIRFTAMPAWGQPGDDDADSWELVHFIRTLPNLSSEQVEEMKTLNPVPAAVVKERLEEEEFLEGDGADGHAH